MNPLPLWIAPVPGDFQPHLTPFLLPGDVVRPCIVVCPGGGYGGRARHEADPIARKFNDLGFHAFVLEYRVHPQAHFPEPQQDALRAIKLVRARAAEFRIRPDAIAILGFSAGGHLAVSASFLYDRIEANAGDAADAASARPDASILCYPVISGVTEPHSGSFLNLLGKAEPAEAELQALSGERNVDADTPPAFLWHTAEDGAVPVANSLNYAAALRKAGVPFALHVFPFGSHGLGLAPDRPDIARWPELCSDFLHRLGW